MAPMHLLGFDRGDLIPCFFPLSLRQLGRGGSAQTRAGRRGCC